MAQTKTDVLYMGVHINHHSYINHLLGSVPLVLSIHYNNQIRPPRRTPRRVGDFQALNRHGRRAGRGM